MTTPPLPAAVLHPVALSAIAAPKSTGGATLHHLPPSLGSF